MSDHVTGVTVIVEVPVIVPLGQPAHAQGHARLNSHISVLHMCAVDGSTVSPITIFEGMQIAANCLVGAPPGSTAQAQKNGYFTAALFIYILRHIIRNHIPSAADLLLLADQMVDVIDQSFWRQINRDDWRNERKDSSECLSCDQQNDSDIDDLPMHHQDEGLANDNAIFGNGRFDRTERS